MADPVVELRGISKRLSAQQALDGVDFRAWPGEVHAVIGENGAGKSTLMEVLSGALLPDRGSVWLGGQPARVHTPADARRPGLVRLGTEARACAAQCAALRIKLTCVRQPAARLSGGNQQKVALARLCIHGGDILLLDEPTPGSDVGSKIEIHGLLRSWAAAGAAIVLVSSYLPELLDVCDTLAVMYCGRRAAILHIDRWRPDGGGRHGARHHRGGGDRRRFAARREGSARGAVVGAVIMAILRNGCNLTGIPNYVQNIVIGAVVIGAVALDRVRNR